MEGPRGSPARMGRALRQVAANASLRRAEAGWLMAIAAEWAYLVSLLVFAYDAGGVVAVGLLSTLRMLPAALCAPLLSSLANPVRRGRVLVAVHSTRGAMVALAAFAVVADLPPALIVVAATAEGIVATLHRPTTLSLLPALARSPEELIAANAVTSTGEAFGVLVGPAIGGVLLLLGGPSLGLIVPAAAFVLASAAVVRVDEQGPLSGVTANPVLVNSMMAGFRALRSYPSAGWLVAIFIGQTFVRGVLTVLLVAASVELLGLGRAGVGYLTSAIGAGGLIGAMAAFGLVVRRELALPFSISAAMWGIPIFLIGLAPQPALAFALLGVVGVANAVLDVSGFTLLQRSIPNEMRSPVFGAFEGLVALSVGGGSLLAPLLVATVGLQPAMALTGLVLPTLALATWRVVRIADGAAVVPHRELTLLRGIPMFAPLTLTALERVAGGMVPFSVGPGEALVREGDAGHEYFLIASGMADVTRDGRPIAALGPGDGFGEIALLRDLQRTATVTAREALDGFRLPRGVFLEAVTGNAVSGELAERVVAQRLP